MDVLLPKIWCMGTQNFMSLFGKVEEVHGFFTHPTYGKFWNNDSFHKFTSYNDKLKMIFLIKNNKTQ